MNSKKMSLLFLTGILVVLALEVAVTDALGVSNGPNYWGMGYPGNLSVSKYKHPKKPHEYIFEGNVILGGRGYDGSHYGTHDWIADAALRTLQNPIKNPLSFSDWTWLINSDVAMNKHPSWKEDYGAYSGSHNTIRSYYTYIFATQMPDMKIKKYPDIQEIDIPEEGIVIKDFSFYGGMWVGQENKHRYHFQVIESTLGNYEFLPMHTAPARVALWLGEAAIKCISNEEEDKNGDEFSAMQPEGAAGWLGSMTHYFADLVVPAHLIENVKYPDIYLVNTYHPWFENQLANLTKWDKSLGSNGGPEQGFFSWDTHVVNLLPITPIAPNIAIALMADVSIKIAFRNDGNHQHIPISGNNHIIAENSGLFINHNTYDTDIFWDWNDDIENFGLVNSNHRYFYDKVETLLCWATYYTACAMQYCYDEGKKRSSDEVLNVDYYVRNPVDPTPPKERTEPDPQTKIDQFVHSIPREKVSRNLKNIADFVRSTALAGVAYVMRTIFLSLR